jgi:CTP synthase (UTP-ammonia lyase)
MRVLTIGVLMDLRPRQAYHAATLAALEHAAGALALDARIDVVGTDTLRDHPDVAAAYAGLVIGPGSPYRDAEAVLDAIRSARERGVPLVGT